MRKVLKFNFSFLHTRTLWVLNIIFLFHWQWLFNPGYSWNHRKTYSLTDFLVFDWFGLQKNNQHAAANLFTVGRVTSQNLLRTCLPLLLSPAFSNFVRLVLTNNWIGTLIFQGRTGKSSLQHRTLVRYFLFALQDFIFESFSMWFKVFQPVDLDRIFLFRLWMYLKI